MNDMEKMVNEARQAVESAEKAVQEARERLEDGLIDGMDPERYEKALTAAEARYESAKGRLAAVESAKVKKDERDRQAKAAAELAEMRVRHEEGRKRLQASEKKLIEALGKLRPLVLEREEAARFEDAAATDLWARVAPTGELLDRARLHVDDIKKAAGACGFEWEKERGAAGFSVMFERR